MKKEMSIKEQLEYYKDIVYTQLPKYSQKDMDEALKNESKKLYTKADLEKAKWDGFWLAKKLCIKTVRKTQIQIEIAESWVHADKTKLIENLEAIKGR